MSDWESRRTVWVGNLEPRVTEEILFELFLQIGPLEDVTKPKNKNFAFILYTHKRSTGYAVRALNNISLFGQMIHVKFREKKRNDESRERMDRRLGDRSQSRGRKGNFRDYDRPRDDRDDRRGRDRGRDRDFDQRRGDDRRRPESYHNDDRQRGGRQVHMGGDPWQARGRERGGNQWRGYDEEWSNRHLDEFRPPPRRDIDNRSQMMPSRSKSASNRRGDPGWR